MKHIIKYILLIAIAAGMQACQKEEAANISFDVTINRLSYNVNDTAIFNITGNPNMVTFWSGEIGHRYAYRNRVSADGKPELKFTSALNTGSQASTLRLMVSNDFAGVVVNDTLATAANIAAANWTDITERATLATNGTAKASGAIDLSDFATQGKPVYIAFKYVAVKGSIQNKWTITGLTVTNTLPDETSYTIANLNATTAAITSNYAGVSTFSPGWISTPVKRTPDRIYHWIVNAGSNLTVAGAPTVEEAIEDTEAWTLMGPLDLRKVTPDAGVSVKAINQVVSSYDYGYMAAGSYTATFIATNQYASKGIQVIREFKIEVE